MPGRFDFSPLWNFAEFMRCKVHTYTHSQRQRESERVFVGWLVVSIKSRLMKKLGQTHARAHTQTLAWYKQKFCVVGRLLKGRWHVSSSSFMCYMYNRTCPYGVWVSSKVFIISFFRCDTLCNALQIVYKNILPSKWAVGVGVTVVYVRVKLSTLTTLFSIFPPFSVS